jgi:hypothetical protein
VGVEVRGLLARHAAAAARPRELHHELGGVRFPRLHPRELLREGWTFTWTSDCVVPPFASVTVTCSVKIRADFTTGASHRWVRARKDR